MVPGTHHVRLLSALMCLWCVLWIATDAANAEPIVNPDVTVTLFRPADEAQKDAEAATLLYPEITVPAKVSSVTGLLNSSNILADSDAIGLMYLLNPQLDKVDGLVAGQTLRMVQVELPPEAAKALSDGFLIKVNYDERLIAAILSQRDTLEQLSPASTRRTDHKDCIRSAAQYATMITDHLEVRDQPLEHQMLLQIQDDFVLLTQLGQRQSEASKIPPDDEETACAVAADLDLKRRGFESRRDASSSSTSRWPQVRVLIRTFDASGTPKPMLRIHWVPQALEHLPGRDQQFPQLSTPSEYMLPEADYIFYATRQDDPTVLGKVAVAVRRRPGSEPLTVDIQVAKP